MTAADGPQAARREEVARELSAGRIPEGVTLHSPDGIVIDGPLDLSAPEPEAEL